MNTTYHPTKEQQAAATFSNNLGWLKDILMKLEASMKQWVKTFKNEVTTLNIDSMFKFLETSVGPKMAPLKESLASTEEIKSLKKFIPALFNSLFALEFTTTGLGGATIRILGEIEALLDAFILRIEEEKIK